MCAFQYVSLRGPFRHFLVLAGLWFCAGGSLWTAQPGRPAASFQVLAWTFDRGNVKVMFNPDIYADYRDKHPEFVLADGGARQSFAEYDLQFPVAATYTLYVRYGSPEPRPFRVFVDGRFVDSCCRTATGNPPPYLDRHPRHDLPRPAVNFHGLVWEEACSFSVSEGKHTLRFTRNGPPPRLCMLRFDCPVPFPKGWKRPERPVRLERIPPRYRRIYLPPGSVNVGTLRAAIEDMIADFGPEYPKGPLYLKKLAELGRRAAGELPPEKKERVEAQLRELNREALLSHPLLKFDKLLFVTGVDRVVSIYTSHVSKGKPGGNLCLLSPVSPSGKVTKLVPELEGGVFGRFDVSFDATKVVFSYAKPGGRYRIYEIDIDPKTGLRASTDLRQLTHDSAKEADAMRCYAGSSYGGGYDDIDPCYLPNGKILFASTRSEHAVLCAPVTATTLYVMESDGSCMRRISSGQVNELAPCVLADGRVAYTRWEYIDKGFGNAQSLWAIHPDGSFSDHIYKNTVVRPASMLNARSIPGSTKIVAIGAGHHGGLAGPVIVVDNRLDRRSPKRMTNLTPEISYPGMFPMTRNQGYFREPYPFSEKLFLVSHNPDPSASPARYAIFVLDRWGNRAELYRDRELSCFQPTPLWPRPKPTEITPVAMLGSTPETQREKSATCFLFDVYEGLTGIERGRVKYIRVMEAMNLSWHDAWRASRQGDGAGQQASAVSYGADVAVKKIHGVVAVHEDGSALFTVPAEKNLYFQVLDENFMELQRMRTFINLMPGEVRSCIGCHEVRRRAPRLRNAMAEALEHPVQSLLPQPGDSGPRTVHFARDVQPLFDKYCIRCHSGPAPKGDLDLTDRLTEKFSLAYETLLKRRLVSYLEGGFGSANLPAELPLTFGSHRSTLIERIRTGPCKALLTREEFIRLVTWIDANVPYYGTHEGKKNLRWKDEPDFRPFPVAHK